MFTLPVDAVGNRVPRRIMLGMAALALGVTTAPAMAQIAPGYSGSSDGGVDYMGNEEIWQALRVFGTCYARVNAPHALELIGTEPGTQAERDAVRRAIRDPQNCFGYVVRVRAPYATLRGAVAEGLFRRRVAIPAALRQAPPARGTESRNIYEAARCVAAAQGDRVRGLLATSMGSRGEREAASALLSGPFRQCVPPEAGTLAMSPMYVRYLLAEALLRLPATASAEAR